MNWFSFKPVAGALAVSGAVAVLTVAAPSASALTITDIGNGGVVGPTSANQDIFQAILAEGDAVDLKWNFDLGNGQFLKALGFLSVQELTATTAKVFVRVDNFSSVPAPGSNINRITSFGLGVGNGVTQNVALSTNGSDLINFNTSNNLTGTLPGTGSGGSVQDIICATSGGSCTGGADGGIFSGDYDVFTFLLEGTFGDTIALDTFGLRFQSVGGGSLSAALPAHVTPVPTPALLPGLVGLGMAALRRNSKEKEGADA